MGTRIIACNIIREQKNSDVSSTLPFKETFCGDPRQSKGPGEIMIDSIITFGNKNSKNDNLIQTNLQLTAALLKCKVGAWGIQGLPPWATSL